ncbi:MAG: Na+/H+ antiporter NhaA [Gaiellaceae bacterium]
MAEQQATSGPLSERTAWSRSLGTPLRDFLRTETGSAVLLLAATLAALVWVNADSSSYETLWRTRLSIRLGESAVSLDLRGWLNTGLMTFFFFVVGLEARREFDIGELRQRRRLAPPLLAALAGMALPVAVYLAFNAGGAGAHGWGAAMSTDTAFALGVLALTGPRFPDRLRSFVLTLVVIDDLVALVVIATVYTGSLAPRALLAAIALFACVLLARRLGVSQVLAYLALGVAIWVALLKSGVDPVVTGLAMGLLTYAYSPARGDLERASDLFRLFREQPTAELARSARAGVESAISPNARLQHLFHPWTSYAIVPLFALANAGIVLSGDFLVRAFSSPVTLGILVGYVAGKPIGISTAAWLVGRLSGGRLRPPVGWAALLGSGAVAGIGFTVSLLIATLAFHGPRLEEAKVGVLSAALLASVTTWLVFRLTELLPPRVRARALMGTSMATIDLAVPVDAGHDHVRGPTDAPVTLVEYGDFECPYCGRAEPVIRELLTDFGDLQYVWRHLPLSDVHPRAQLAAEASEAAAAQGAFWEMHDLLLERQDALHPPDLIRYAEQLGLDPDRFERDLRAHGHAGRVAGDVDSADLSGVSGTPTFFVNGRRHHGAYDLAALSAAVRAARERSALAS